MEGEHRHLAVPDGGGRLHLGHGGGVRPEAVAAMHQRDRARAMAQLGAPDKGGIAPADDDDVLPLIAVGVRHQLLDAAPVPGGGARLRQAPRPEGADPGGDDHRPGGKAVGFGDQDEVAVRLLQRHDPLPEVGGDPRRLVELRRLVGEVADEVLGQHPGEVGHVADVLLGVEGRELSPQLGEGVDHLRGGPAHAGVEEGEEAGGAAPQDGQVADLVRAHGGKIAVPGRLGGGVRLRA